MRFVHWANRPAILVVASHGACAMFERNGRWTEVDRAGSKSSGRASPNRTRQALRACLRAVTPQDYPLQLLKALVALAIGRTLQRCGRRGEANS